MNLEVLISCMNQNDVSIVEKSRLTGDVLIVNQCPVCPVYPFQIVTLHIISPHFPNCCFGSANGCSNLMT